MEARRVIAGGLGSDVISAAKSGVELHLCLRQYELQKSDFSRDTELYFNGENPQVHGKI